METNVFQNQERLAAWIVLDTAAALLQESRYEVLVLNCLVLAILFMKMPERIKDRNKPSISCLRSILFLIYLAAFSLMLESGLAQTPDHIQFGIIPPVTDTNTSFTASIS